MGTERISSYRRRRLDEVLDALLATVPAVMLVGPRAAGKTTTAARRAASVLRLDRPDEAEAFRADPDAILRGLPEPVLIDEWQIVPEALHAVKRACDDQPDPGRFLITGSVRAAIETPLWPGTGRVVIKRIYGFTQAELAPGHPPPFVDRCFGAALDPPRADLDLRDLVALALRGGFPSTLELPEIVLGDWLASYLEQLVARDLVLARPGADRELLRRYVESLAIATATVTDLTQSASAAGVSRKTARTYQDLLSAVHVMSALPAWHSNRLKRVTRRPKQHLVEPALLAPTARVDTATALGDAHLMGRLLESFVVAQIRAELEWSATRPRMHHLRLEKGEHEVDLILEGGGRVVAIEVKAAAAVSTRDARHLAWLRDRLGDRFALGVVLHCGKLPRPLGDRLLAAPIESLWRTGGDRRADEGDR